jgi:hypothetical protein
MDMLAIKVGSAPETVAGLSEEIGYDRPVAHVHCPLCHVSYSMYGGAHLGTDATYLEWSENKLKRECPDHPDSFRTPTSLNARGA